MQKNKDFRKKRNPNSSEKTGGKSSGKSSRPHKYPIIIRILIGIGIGAAAAAIVFFSLKLSFSIAHSLFGEHVGLDARLPDGDKRTTAQYTQPDAAAQPDPEISFPMVAHDSQVSLGWVEEDQISDIGVYLEITDFDTDLCKLYVRITNHAEEEIPVSGSYSLYYKEDDAWIELTAPSDENIATLFPLSAGSSLDIILPLRELTPLAPGEYRLVLSDLEVHFNFDPAE